jgi:hypothetical protein
MSYIEYICTCRRAGGGVVNQMTISYRLGRNCTVYNSPSSLKLVNKLYLPLLAKLFLSKGKVIFAVYNWNIGIF